MNYQDFLTLTQKRRSIRKFKPEPIPNDFIDKIIEAARWAPSGGNSQPWDFIVIKKKELKDQIANLIQEQYGITHKMEMLREPKLRFPKYTKPPVGMPGFATAPVFILPIGDTRTKEVYPKDMSMTMADSIFITSMANALMYLILATNPGSGRPADISYRNTLHPGTDQGAARHTQRIHGLRVAGNRLSRHGAPGKNHAT